MTTLDRHKYLTPDETARLLDLLDREAIVARARGHRLPVRDAMLIRLAIISGLRASELCALTVADLALVHGQPPRVRVRVRCGKGGKARDVPLPTSLRKPLKVYCRLDAKRRLRDGRRRPAAARPDRQPVLRCTPLRMNRCTSSDIVRLPGGVPFRAHP